MRVIISSLWSGSGKTTVTTGIILNLKEYDVRGYKIGPDYIDTMYISKALGKPARNLDIYLMGDLITANYEDGDIGIIEGVMGILDGKNPSSDYGSTAHVSKILKAPIILVINAKGMARTILPIIKGILDYDKELSIKGIIFNKVSKRHEEILKKALEELDIVVLGSIPEDEEISIFERHLGLTTPYEIPEEKFEKIKKVVGDNVDIEGIIKIAREFSGKIETKKMKINQIGKVKIGVAFDKAFNFYYFDNLKVLEMLGAEIIFFSPLQDKKLPEVDGIYIGGGFPEIFAKELSKNREMMDEIKKASKRIPIYAECGGLIYLSEGIFFKEEFFPMCGVIPGKVYMTKRLQNFGYKEIEFLEDTIIGKKGEKAKGHEFHYSIWDYENEGEKENYSEEKSKKIGKPIIANGRKCGYSNGKIFASYIHIHFFSNIKIAENFINAIKNNYYN